MPAMKTPAIKRVKLNTSRYEMKHHKALVHYLNAYFDHLTWQCELPGNQPGHFILQASSHVQAIAHAFCKGRESVIEECQQALKKASR